MLRSLPASTWVAVPLLLAVAVVVPLLNLATDPSSAWHVPTYMVSLLGKYLCFAILALSLDLVWGYCGILSLGHGAFFALGGYAMGMYLMRQIGARGVYANPELPDFMVFLNWQELPWYWHGFDMFWFAALMIVLVPGALAFVFGWFAFRSRVTGVYLSIITQAMTFALLLAFFRNDMGFGGNNGLTDFKDILGFDIQAAGTRAALFAATAVALALGFAVCAFIVGSRTGKVLVAIRDAESRTRFCGYRVEHYKLFVWTFSAMLAGIGGALYVPQAGIINPSEFAPANSIEAVIWVAFGGRGTLWGAILGGVGVNAIKSWLTGSFPELWLYALGALFIATTLFLPKGIAGLLTGLLSKRRPPARIAPTLAAGQGVKG
ncbi:MAG: urea ABC transporter permease subunit UrtC [Geminicoccaceae bacterium]